MPRIPKGDPSAVAEANNAFGCDLYEKLATETGNHFFSPFSIEAALSMTCAGAKGNTLAEMQKVLHLPADSDKIHIGFQSLFAVLNGDAISVRTRGYELSVANALWGMKGEPWRKEFLTVASKYYGGGLIEVDFNKPDSAAKTINAWVERKTHERIKNLVSTQSFTALTRLVLTNAIYFKGSWDTAFKKDSTKVEPFHRLDGTKRDASLMHRFDDFAYAETDAYQAIELTYKGKDLSMLVWLPRRADAFAEFDKKMTGAMIAETAKALQPNTKVELTLPKFKLNTSYSLEAPLAALGMKDAFTANADFRGLSTSSEILKVDAVLHKAFVEVNEEGTEATAASAVSMGTLTAVPNRNLIENKIFRADRPFLFAIRHIPSNAVLFLGRVTDLG